MKRCILVILMGMMFMAGCDILNSIKGLAPGVTFKEMPLVESPSISNLAAYYCPDVLGSTACSIALPSPPDKDSLKFVFEPRFGVANKNNFPIPTTEVLVAIQLFKGTATQKLGAVCVQLCAENSPGCTGAPNADSCKSDKTDIRTIDDFASGAEEGLVNLVTDVAIDGKPNLDVRTIPAKGDISVKFQFGLGVDSMVNILSTVVTTIVPELISGSTNSLDIPYNTEGTLWFQVPYLGRLGIGFGPFDSTWQIK
jgi:hypothetical protein